MASRDSFSRRHPSPIIVNGGRVLRTVADARAYMLDLPDELLERRWHRAAELMLEDADVDAIARQGQGRAVL